MPTFTKDKLEQAIIALLGEQGFPHTPGLYLLIRDEVYKEIFEQAENFKKYRPAAS